jgi:putative FmdB family regulatory protein
MPTYEYKCNACDHAFEKFQRMSEAPLRVCPKCGGEVRRLIGKGAGIIFKGTGFYCTDYRSGGAATKDAPAPKTETAAAPAAKESSQSSKGE